MPFAARRPALGLEAMHDYTRRKDIGVHVIQASYQRAASMRLRLLELKKNRAKLTKMINMQSMYVLPNGMAKSGGILIAVS